MQFNHHQERGVLEVDLSWQDYERLVRGETIGDRYNPESKFELIMVPVERGVNWTTTMDQRETATLDRRSDDILVEIPEGPLRCMFVRAFHLGKDFGNLKTVYGPSHPLLEHIRVQYPN